MRGREGVREEREEEREEKEEKGGTGRGRKRPVPDISVAGATAVPGDPEVDAGLK